MLARLLLLGAAAALLTSCRVDMAVRVESDEFGAGRIAVTAELDRNAAAAVFAQQSSPVAAVAAPTDAAVGRVQIDDFRRTGWEGPGVVRKADGSARFALFHRFTSVEEANKLLRQVSGSSGPLSDLRITRKRSPWSTVVSLSGKGDFRSGLASFGDERLASATGNGAFGVSDAEVVRQAGADSLDSVFELRVDARLLAAERSWKLPSGASTPVLLSASRTSWATLAGTATAALALIVLVALHFRSNRPGGGAPGPEDDESPRSNSISAAGAVDAVGPS